MMMCILEICLKKPLQMRDMLFLTLTLERCDTYSTKTKHVNERLAAVRLGHRRARIGRGDGAAVVLLQRPRDFGKRALVYRADVPLCGVGNGYQHLRTKRTRKNKNQRKLLLILIFLQFVLRKNMTISFCIFL